MRKTLTGGGEPALGFEKEREVYEKTNLPSDCSNADFCCFLQ